MFIEFLKFNKQQELGQLAEQEKEKAGWNIELSNQGEAQHHNGSEFKPIFKPEAISKIFEILKDFFSIEEQRSFEQILKTANDTTEKLIFLGNGNRLADAFKQLIKSDIITGCNQRQLENWIERNFKYRFRNQVRNFTQKYLNDIISTNKDKCQNPILNVVQDKANGSYSIRKP